MDILYLSSEEELWRDYDTVYLHFDKNEQKTAEFLRLNPNGRIPVIVDHDHEEFVLADIGSDFALPGRAERQALADRAQAASPGHAVAYVPDERGRPMLGQAMFFQRIAAPKGIVDDYAIERYVKNRNVCLAS